VRLVKVHAENHKEDEVDATMNLVKMDEVGRFTVVSMPWLKQVRQERLAEESEA